MSTRCVALPIPSLPKLPSPLSLTPPSVPGADVGLDVKLCCKLPPLALPIPPIPIPPLVLNPAVIAALNAAIGQALAYVNSLPLSCPLE